MTFAGSKFVFYVLGVSVAFFSSTILFLLCYGLFLTPETTSGTIIGVWVVTALIGVGFGVLAYKICFNVIVQVLSAIVGIVFGFMLTSAFHLHGAGQIAVIVVFAIGAVFVGHKLRRFIRSGATALIGAFLLIRGISYYAGGLDQDDLEDDAQKGKVWGYLFGFIGLAVVGTIFQMKKVDVDEDENDTFKSESEGKVCGCF